MPHHAGTIDSAAQMPLSYHDRNRVEYFAIDRRLIAKSD